MSVTIRILGLLAGLLLAAGATAAQPDGARHGDLLGARQWIPTGEKETLLDVARTHGIGYVEMRLANPEIDPWLPGANRLVTVPGEHLLPPVRRRGIVINLAELRLYYFPDDGEPMSFPVGIGSEGTETPLGTTRIERKRADPSWTPTASMRRADPTLPVVVPPGPENPMGSHALYLGWPAYAIHGTNRPYSIGRRGSHGCIRMYPEDIARLFPLVKPGTPVTVVDLPYKFGWHDDELYVEVHPPQHHADRIESGELPPPEPDFDLTAPVLEVSGNDIVRVDWNAVERARLQQSGMPVRITRRDVSLSDP